MTQKIRKYQITENFKVIIISEANRLSKGAQHALRRTMEKYMAQCRLILLTESISKLIPALRSRCLGIRLVLFDPEILFSWPNAS